MNEIMTGREAGAASPAMNAVELSEAFTAFNKSAESMKFMYSKLEDRVSYLTDELERKSRELERANRLAAIGRLAAGVAHEIRNPLGGIELCASLLNREEDADEDKKALVANILESVRRMNNIVTSLLTFSQDNKIAVRDTDIGRILDEALDAVQAKAKAGGVNLVKIGTCRSLTIKADEDKLRQVFINILLNGVEAMPGGGDVGISMAKRHDRSFPGGFLVVSFSDRGPGITKADMQKIFQPFFTTKECGTGLGLALSHKIIEAHNGRITIKSVRGTGTKVNIFLPLLLTQAKSG
jgi:two-component system, sporulation sensor kinase E